MKRVLIVCVAGAGLFAFAVTIAIPAIAKTRPPNARARQVDSATISRQLKSDFHVLTLARAHAAATSLPIPGIIAGTFRAVPFMAGGSSANVVEQNTSTGGPVWIAPGPQGICIAIPNPPQGLRSAPNGHFGVCQTTADAATYGVEAVSEGPNGTATVTGIMPTGNSTVSFMSIRSSSARVRTEARVRYNVFSVALPRGSHWESMRSAITHKVHRWRIA